MNGELYRKIKEAKSLHEKYIQMMTEHTVKENMTDEDFNRRIMRVYHCMINAYDEINQEIGLSYNKCLFQIKILFQKNQNLDNLQMLKKIRGVTRVVFDETLSQGLF